MRVESIKSSSPTKIQPNLRTYSCAAGSLYFETVERYRYYFYVAAISVTDIGRQAREHMVPESYQNIMKFKKIICLHHFLYLTRPFLEWIILVYHSPVRFFLKAGKSQTTVFWVRPSSQLP